MTLDLKGLNVIRLNDDNYNCERSELSGLTAGPALQRGPGGPRPTQHFRPDDVIVTWRNR